MRERSATDVTLSAVRARIGCANVHKGLALAWAGLVGAWEAGARPALLGRHVRFGLVSYGAGGPPRHCIHEDDVPLLAEAAGIVEPAPEGWMSRDRFAEAIGCYPYHPGFKALWDRLKEAYEREGVVRAADGRLVRMRLYRIHARTALCIDIAEADWYDREAGLTERLRLPDHPEWTPGWLARDDVGRAIDATPTTEFFLDLWKEVRAIAEGPGHGTLRGRPVRAAILARTTRVTAYLHEGSVAAFNEVHAGIKEERREGYRDARRASLAAAQKVRMALSRRGQGLRGVAREPRFAVTRTLFASKVAEHREAAGLPGRLGGGHARVREVVAGRWSSLARRVDAGSLWLHQREAVRSFAGCFADVAAPPSGVCVIPPGGGKTEIFANLLDAAMTDDGPGIPNVIVLVPTQQMVEQTLTRLSKGFPSLSPGALSASHSDVRPLTVMTYAGFAWAVGEGVLGPDDVDVLVLDECHRALSEIRKDVFGRFVGRTLATAFSATPAFDTVKNVYALLGVHGPLVDVPLARLIDQHVLAPVANYVVCVSLEGKLPPGRKARAEVIRKATAAAARDLHDRFLDEVTGLRLSDRKFIAFTHDRAHNAAGVAAFGSSPRRVEALSGKDALSRQLGVVEGVRRGDVDGIFNARLLVEGMDVPRIGAVLNVAHTDSLVVEIQRSGRAIRLDPDLAPDDPAQTAMVFDFYVEHEGKVLGKPRFFFEAVGGDIPVSLVSGPGIPVSRLSEQGSRRQPAATTEAAAWHVTSRAEPRTVRYLLARRDQTHDHRTAEWLPRTHVMAALRATAKNPRFEAAWDALEEAWSGDVSSVGGREFRFALKRATSGDVLCLHRDDVAAFALVVGIDTSVGAASEERLGKIDASKAIKVCHKGSPFPRLWDEILRAYEAGPPYLVRGEELDLAMVRGRVHTYLSVHRRHLAWMRLACGHGIAEPMSKAWLGFSEFREDLAASKSSSRLMDAWKVVKNAAEAGVGHAVIAGRRVEVGTVERKGRVIPVVRATSKADFLAALGSDLADVPLRDKTWLRKVEVAKGLRLNPQAEPLESLFGKVIPAGLPSGSIRLGDEVIRVALRKSAKGHRMPCIHADDLPALARHIGTPPMADAAWIPRTRACWKLRTSLDSRFREIWDELAERVAAGARPEVGGRPVRFEFRKTRPTACFHIHEDDLAILADAAGVMVPGAPGAPQAWRQGWTARNRTARAIGRKPEDRAFLSLWDEIMAVEGTGTVRGVPVRVATMRRNSQVSTFLEEAALPALRALLDEGA